MGGLLVDEETGQVLANEGGAVPGLYAAGRTAVGICSHYYVSGLSLGDCVFSGLRAAERFKREWRCGGALNPPLFGESDHPRMWRGTGGCENRARADSRHPCPHHFVVARLAGFPGRGDLT